MQIAEVPASEVPMELLLDADPSEERIAGYLAQSRCFVARDAGAVIGACVVQALGSGVYELVNIAVAPSQQRRGCGRQLLRHAIAWTRGAGASRLQVGTAAWGHYPKFYEREGFRIESIDRGFFLRNYAEPVIEDGFVHEDMVRLALALAPRQAAPAPRHDDPLAPPGRRYTAASDADARDSRNVTDAKFPTAIVAADAPPRAKPTAYPEPFAARMSGRRKHPLGDLFGLTNFGVNLTRLAPGAVTALRHAHSRQDEFVYVLEGHPTLHTNAGRTPLAPGMCAGFKAGTGDAHRVVNETGSDVVILEVGDRSPGDEGTYPDDDIAALLVEGRWTFAHKDGTPY